MLEWFWVQYTPGAAGRIILSCATTANSVGDWFDKDVDPVEWCTKYFCQNADQHMKSEIKMPYKFDWYTRQLPFDRGDNLSNAEVLELVLQDPVANRHVSENKKLACQWNKPYLPQWFDGKALVVYCDKISEKWLLSRRKELFYEWKDSTVKLMRYRVEGIENKDMISKFTDGPATELDIKDPEQFLKDDYEQEKINVPVTTNLYRNKTYVPLSFILDPQCWDQIWVNVELLLEDNIDRNWCNKVMKVWHQRWVA
jgi:hypothetical protein